MGNWETFWAALGISHPEERQDEKQSDVFFSVKEIRESSWLCYSRNDVPVVIFPEGTKTNGVGVLKVDPGMIQLIVDACNDFRVASLRFDHQFKYYSPYNTVDTTGIKSFFSVIS